MILRRTLIASLSAAPTAAVLAIPARAAKPSFEQYLAGVRAEARRKGVSAATLDRAFKGLRPNPRVVELDRNQPESTFSWHQYKTRIVSDVRVARGRELYRQHRQLIDDVSSRYGVPAGILVGIWGLESNYGQSTGGFNVIECLATLAWDGRREAFFRSELLDALKILESGDITPERMTGSWAGAMGQTQFMPDSFLRYAVPGRPGGRRDIWGDLDSVFASTANYLAREGFARGVPWGEPAVAPPGLAPADTGRDHRRPLAEWLRLGARVEHGQPKAPLATSTALLLPGGVGEEAYFAYYPSFLALRRYNPADSYCISVGLIGDRVTA